MRLCMQSEISESAYGMGREREWASAKAQTAHYRPTNQPNNQTDRMEWLVRKFHSDIRSSSILSRKEKPRKSHRETIFMIVATFFFHSPPIIHGPRCFHMRHTPKPNVWTFVWGALRQAFRFSFVCRSFQQQRGYCLVVPKFILSLSLFRFSERSHSRNWMNCSWVCVCVGECVYSLLDRSLSLPLKTWHRRKTNISDYLYSYWLYHRTRQFYKKKSTSNTEQ